MRTSRESRRPSAHSTCCESVGRHPALLVLLCVGGHPALPLRLADHPACTRHPPCNSCCACDDGGDLLACDGPCMRSFHVQTADEEDGEQGGEEQPCNLLRLPAELAAALRQTRDTFRCPNCLAGRQQCYACKREGKEGSEVFK